MNRILRGRSRKPECPFCGRFFERPRDIKTKIGNIFAGGKCECGAAYVYDRSGRNLGEAYVDAMVYACDEDWDKAWQLTPEEDYEIRSVHYDADGHVIIERTRAAGRSGENLLFVRLKKK